MLIFETVAVAFSMFSAIPMPQFEWTKRNMRYALCAFPLIGAVIGAVCALWSLVCTRFALPELLRGAGFCLIPIFITGGIHLDGYADTWDARASHASFERRQEIMKDAHLGAFAAIHLGCYLIASTALWSALREYEFALALGFCLSRTLSALAVASFPMAKDTGLAHTFANAADKKRVRAVLLVQLFALCAAMCACSGGIFVVSAALAVFAYYYYMSKKQFGGISGDLAGWFLQTAELAMLAAAVAYEYIG